MGHVSIEHAHGNLAEYNRLIFIEMYPRDVGTAALREYTGAVPTNSDVREVAAFQMQPQAYTGSESYEAAPGLTQH